jgi:hypothetical protein
MQAPMVIRSAPWKVCTISLAAGSPSLAMPGISMLELGYSAPLPSRWEARSFPGGQGKHGDSIDVSTAPTGKDKSVGVRGLAMDPAGRGCSSPRAPMESRSLGRGEMTFVRKWSVPRPGALAIAGDQSVWVISRKESNEPARILHFASDGSLLPDVITGPRGALIQPQSGLSSAQTPWWRITARAEHQDLREPHWLAARCPMPPSVRAYSPGRQERSLSRSSGQAADRRCDRCAREHLRQHERSRAGFLLARWRDGAGILDRRRPAPLAQARAGVCRLRSADPASDKGTTLDIFDIVFSYRLDLSRTARAVNGRMQGTRSTIQVSCRSAVRARGGRLGLHGGTFVRTSAGAACCMC